MKLVDIIRYYNTIRYLKPIQIYCQLYYRLRKIIRKTLKIKYPLSIEKKGESLTLKPYIEKNKSFEDGSFSFLNLEKSFSNIDWEYEEYGKLWNYNLNYFDFLLQPEMEIENGLNLIKDYISKLNENSTGLEPYPISIRGINWVKFISKFNIKDQFIDKSLYAQYQILSKNIEYHLLGNHLLENEFSLLFGAFYFNDINLYKKANQILENELKEQILNDGGHFELSPIYHQIIFDRLLDSINLLQNNMRFDDQKQLLNLFEEKASKMLEWLTQMTFSNGQIPHFNDSTEGMAPTTEHLINYSKRLGVKTISLQSTSQYSPLHINHYSLSDSGYRRFNGDSYECIIDVGQIGPDYIPGHAHADMLSFVLHINQKPIIVDIGISTYEKNEIRQLERSTVSHNTVVVNNQNQSDVWGGFRVGKRARLEIIKDKSDRLEASHNGYKPIIHKRNFIFYENGFSINDNLSIQSTRGKAYLHFHPDRKILLFDNRIIIDNKLFIEILLSENISIEEFNQPIAYNKSIESKKVMINFKGNLELKFDIN